MLSRRSIRAVVAPELSPTAAPSPPRGQGFSAVLGVQDGHQGAQVSVVHTLVPALITDVGQRVWWPSALARTDRVASPQAGHTQKTPAAPSRQGES